MTTLPKIVHASSWRPLKMGADNCDRGVNDGVVDDEEVVESDYDDIGLDGNKPSVVERRPFNDDIGLDGNKPFHRGTATIPRPYKLPPRKSRAMV